jgi:hypothetical protein
MLRPPLLITALLVLSAAPAAAAITVDGTLEASAYGAALATQTTQTNFGNATDGQIGFTNGSELDAIHVRKVGSNLYVFLSGNLQSNYNKLELFFDTKAGGQAKLRGNNPNVDFNGLNRMGDDGSNNGLRFDAGFEADYWVSVTNGDAGGGTHKLFVNYAELLTAGGGAGYYVGEGVAGGTGALSGGTNPFGMRVSINNSNTGGVNDGCNAASGAGVTTGIELLIPDDALGFTGPWTEAKDIRICAFVNGGGHDFVSNQVAAPLAVGTCNLGEPRAVDFAAQSGDQFVSIELAENVPAVTPWQLGLVSLALLAGGLFALRRRGASLA